MTIHAFTRALTSATIALALAACGSSASSTSSSASSAPADAPSAAATIGVAVAAPDASDACALVTPAEASTAMGAPAQPPIRAKDHDGFASCRYYGANKTKNVFVQFVDPQLAGAVSGQTLAGVGDKATWMMGSIFVTKGGRAAQIGLYLNDKSLNAMDPAEETLATDAAGRL